MGDQDRRVAGLQDGAELRRIQWWVPECVRLSPRLFPMRRRNEMAPSLATDQGVIGP